MYTNGGGIKLVVILDPDFGSRIAGMDSDCLIYVRQSKQNENCIYELEKSRSPVAESIRNLHFDKHRSLLGNLVRQLLNVEVPWSSIEVYGLELDDKVQRSLYGRFYLQSFQHMNHGFKADVNLVKLAEFAPRRSLRAFRVFSMVACWLVPISILVGISKEQRAPAIPELGVFTLFILAGFGIYKKHPFGPLLLILGIVILALKILVVVPPFLYAVLIIPVYLVKAFADKRM